MRMRNISRPSSTSTTTPSTLKEDAARLVAQREAQGLPLHVADPLALRRVALVLRGAGLAAPKPNSEQEAA
jgi:hypothetical protein